MLVRLSLVVVAVSWCQGFPRPESPQSPGDVEARQFIYVPERQQYNPQYDLSLLEPQFQIPPYNFIGDKQPFPRVQPQIVLYHGGAPGQPFLVNPGAPPGNFLVPHQPGPNVILRDSPPGRPFFVAGYPKPAHIPPIEKDAEEIPTNPSKIPPLTPKVAGGRRPEKLETLDEGPNGGASEADVLAAADRNPHFNTRTNLQPGQRFFILNGQPLFSNYPYNNQIYPGINPNINFKYAQGFAPQKQQLDDIAASHREADVPQQSYPENLILLNHPEDLQNAAVFRSSSPLTKDVKLDTKEALNNEEPPAQQVQNDDDDDDDDTVVIEARDQDEPSNTESGGEASPPEKFREPTISQAQPGAIALAGPGGVASAAPRGTAFVGREGVAVSSPQATAVAGPSKKDPAEKKEIKTSN